VVADAATGFGKTPLILAALLSLAFRHGFKIVWAVRTGTETDRPIEELKVIHEYSGRKHPLFGFSFRGKKDMCLLAEDLKRSGRIRGTLDHESVALICKLYGRKCPYRKSFEENFHPCDTEWFFEEPRLYTEILSFCKEKGICPYQTQLYLVEDASVVSMSYNYVLNEKIGRFLDAKIGFEDSLLVVDEAHNLQFIGSELYSDRITLRTILNAEREAKEVLRLKEDHEIFSFLDALHRYVEKLSEQIRDEDAVFDVADCVNYCSEDFYEFEVMAEKAKRLGNRVRRMMLEAEKAPRSSLHHLGVFWLNTLEKFGVEGVAFLAKKEEDSPNISVEMFDMRSEVLLRKVWEKFRACIFCSGTVKPIESFAEVVGLENYAGKVFPSPYPKENVLTLLTLNLSTRGEELSDEMAEEYIKTLDAFMEAVNRNIAIFSASYRIQNKLLNNGLKEIAEKHGRKLLIEDKHISGGEARNILEEFKACAQSDVKGVLCGAVGGRFAEGADFPGRELEAIFLVGVPFEKPTTKTNLYIEYYEKLYGKDRGRYYAYILPALKRASQALGRALRSKQDKAIFILGDYRYKGYIELLPDYAQKKVKQVKTVEQVKAETKNFVFT